MVPEASAIDVEIGEPIFPSGEDFGSVVRLRDAARRDMLSRCGEPDIEDLIKPEAAVQR